MPRWCLLVLLLLTAACDTRPPIGQVEVVRYADDLLRREGLWWGSPIEILRPELADPEDRRWWQLRYAEGAVTGPGTAATASRVVLVDAATGWARLPPAGHPIRVPAIGKPSAAAPVTVQEGPFVLLVSEPATMAPERRAELEREASRLNAMGTEGGLYPLFSVRTDRQGRSALVYGWQGDRGIQREARVGDWLQARTPYGVGTWVDLSD